MRLSIITPCFNSIAFLQPCIEHVASQIEEGVEHIVIDGGSTDGSLEILSELSARHSHLKYVSEKDEGQSDAMNKGLQIAKAPVVGFLNVDDRYCPGALSSILRSIVDCQGPLFKVGNCIIENEQGKIIQVDRPQKTTFSTILITKSFPPNPSAYFYSKSIHDEVGYYDVENHFGMDADFLLKAVRVVNFEYYNEDWGVYRYLPSTKTYQNIQSGGAITQLNELLDSHMSNLPVLERLRIRAMRTVHRLKTKLL